MGANTGRMGKSKAQHLTDFSQFFSFSVMERINIPSRDVLSDGSALKMLDMENMTR